MRKWVLAFAVLCAFEASAQESEPHLRLGAAHFRAGRFAEAVVEFRVARELGAGDEAHWYVAAALTRAGRTDDALEAFGEAAELAPKSADALFLYYRGVACSDAQLVVCAAEAFERAARSAGPKVAEQARKLAAEARAVLKAPVPEEALRVLASRAAEARKANRPRLAALIEAEAQALTRSAR